MVLLVSDCAGWRGQDVGLGVPSCGPAQLPALLPAAARHRDRGEADQLQQAALLPAPTDPGPVRPALPPPLPSGTR